jgi:hypothetical protein
MSAMLLSATVRELRLRSPNSCNASASCTWLP